MPISNIEKSLYFPIEKERVVDGSEYVRDAFGGLGPSSPEYDHDRRLEIVVPDARSAVRWFKDTDVKPGYTSADKTFKVSIPEAKHTGVDNVSVGFVKTPNTSLITGTVELRPGALSIPEAPKYTADGAKIDTYNPAKRLLGEHLQERLTALYPGQVDTSRDSTKLSVSIGEGLDLFLDFTNSNLHAAMNGESYISHRRHDGTKPTPRQLESELKAMQQYFPPVVEAVADFFRKQLPKTKIEIVYKSPKANAHAKDPINPQRLAQLRQELVIEPRDDDFKYIGGLDEHIARLQETAVGFAHPEAFREFGTEPPRGILLQGPPGTGKTSLAMAFAHDAEAVVLDVKPSKIKNAFHGETERNMRGVFDLADELIEEGERVVIFIDELEVLAPARDSFGTSSIDNNVTTELLQGMNVDRKDCIIIGATNVPGMVDPALIANGSRFSEQLEIPLPDKTAREDIISRLFLKFTDRSTGQSHGALFDIGVRIDGLAQCAEGLSGSEIENAIGQVLRAKAVVLATTGKNPGPATHGELYSKLMNKVVDKSNATQSYL